MLILVIFFPICCYFFSALSFSPQVQLHDLLLRDNTALVGAAPSMAPGTVLASWKPDESWSDEEMLRMCVA